MAAEKQNSVHKKTEFYPRKSPFWWIGLGKTEFYPRKSPFWWIEQVVRVWMGHSKKRLESAVNPYSIIDLFLLFE